MEDVDGCAVAGEDLDWWGASVKLAYITSPQLVADALSLAQSIPWSVVKRLRGVVGIPRSGLIPAAVIAQAWNLPMLSLSGEVMHGHRVVRSGGGELLLVDDSIYRGRTDA
jgi:glutamine phosphoribosylpyrophosphate amidotransferase